MLYASGNQVSPNLPRHVLEITTQGAQYGLIKEYTFLFVDVPIFLQLDRDPQHDLSYVPEFGHIGLSGYLVVRPVLKVTSQQSRNSLAAPGSMRSYGCSW